MRHYQVQVKYRPNANKSEVVTREILVTAPNKNAAMVLAGNRIGLDISHPAGQGIVPWSLEVLSVERIRF